MKADTVNSVSIFIILVIALFWIAACEDVSLKTASQLSSALTHTSIQVTGGCSDLQPSDLKLLLYTRNSPNRSTTVNAANPHQIDARKKVIILTHGWVGSSTTYGFTQLKDAYLKRYDCNLIILDWSKLSWKMYPTSVCYLPKIAEFMANFLCLLNRRSKMDLNTVHLVGHSLGAQMSGLIGQLTVTTCGQKIGRITGLDAAGPLYYSLPTSLRLDKSDAVFVDVLHTNQGFLGYVGNCGHVDFYVNCGLIQPGCQEVDLDDMMDHPTETTYCDHFRSMYYMTESISSNNFKARPCKDCPMICTPDASKLIEITMGEDCPRNASGAYVLNTNSQPPFALGSQNHVK